MESSLLKIELDKAFGNYFLVSRMLKEDLGFLLDQEDGSDSWKRNFIRAAIPLIEGYCYSFREVAAVYLRAGGPLHAKESQAVLNERAYSAIDRIKLNIRTAHMVLVDGETSTDFGDGNWDLARDAINKRDALMHPSSESSLAISEAEWERIYQGIVWLTSEVFGIYNSLHERLENGR